MKWGCVLVVVCMHGLDLVLLQEQACVCVCVVACVTGRGMVKDRGKNSLWWPSWCLAKHTEEDTCTL